MRKILTFLFAALMSVGMWAEPITCTAADFGKVLCTDGSIYENVAAATAASKTAVAMIAYVDTENNKGLALALTDETSTKSWQVAIDACSAKNSGTPVTGATWMLPSKDQWDYMINAAGGSMALRDGFSGVGGSNLQSDGYWSSTEYNPSNGYFYAFYSGSWDYDYKSAHWPVRACLAFDITPATVAVNITPNVDPQNDGVYYSTFYDGSVDYALPANVKAYKAVISGSNLLLSEVAAEGDVLPKGNAVILKSTVASFILTPSEAAPVSVGDDNDLEGSDDAIDTPANCYVLSCENNLVGFYQYSGTKLNPHKAYVVFSGSNQAPRRMPFIFDAATGVENVQGNVQSTKVLRDGQLIIIRNGVEYNANGMMVK